MQEQFDKIALVDDTIPIEVGRTAHALSLRLLTNTSDHRKHDDC
jgi:hypothetical protein